MGHFFKTFLLKSTVNKKGNRIVIYLDYLYTENHLRIFINIHTKPWQYANDSNLSICLLRFIQLKFERDFSPKPSLSHILTNIKIHANRKE